MGRVLGVGAGLVIAAFVMIWLNLPPTCCADPGPEVSLVPGPTEEVSYAPDCTDVVYVLPAVTSFVVRLDRSEPVDVEVPYRIEGGLEAVEVAEGTDLSVGMAEPGVHFAPLPGVVTVPAGSTEAVVEISALPGTVREVVGLGVAMVDGGDYRLGEQREASLIFVSPRAADAPPVDCAPGFRFTDARTNTQQTVRVGEGLVALEVTELVVAASVIDGQLPPGLALNDDGSFAGVAEIPGTYIATIEVESDHHLRAVRETTLTVEVLDDGAEGGDDA